MRPGAPASSARKPDVQRNRTRPRQICGNHYGLHALYPRPYKCPLRGR